MRTRVDPWTTWLAHAQVLQELGRKAAANQLSVAGQAAPTEGKDTRLGPSRGMTHDRFEAEVLLVVQQAVAKSARRA